MNRDLFIGLTIALLLHGIVGYWGVTLGPLKHVLPPEPMKVVKTVRQDIVLPKKKEEPKPEPPKPELKPEVADTPQEVPPDSAPKPVNKPKNEAPQPAQKPAEPAPLVLSKTYGASDGSGVAVNAGKEDTLGDPSVDPDEKNTRQRFQPKVAQQAAPSDDGADDGTDVGGKKVEIVHAVPKTRCRVEWPEGAEAAGRSVEVAMLLDIAPDGTVEKVRVLRGAGDPFDDEAMAAMKQCAFNPGTRDGKPFRDRIKFAVEFKPSR